MINCVGITGFCIRSDNVSGGATGGTSLSRGNRIFSVDGLRIQADDTYVLDNLLSGNCSGLGTAMIIEGQFNVIRDNIVAGCEGRAGLAQGIVFLQDGNF